ncbi:MAG: 3-deoxy-manno-octulosonate cytidylyltransferase [Alphaproteobacteria bacterium]
MTSLVIIPARMASTRLPGKPLADIAGKPMIVRVWERAREADLGPVVVAAAEVDIADAVRDCGGEAVLTDPDLPSGSDRAHAALKHLDPDGRVETVINLQGDLPTLAPEAVQAVAETLQGDPALGLATLASPITDPRERDDPAVVKAILSLPEGATAGRALYFTRATAPSGDGPLYHHIGLYGFRRVALERFVSLPPSPLEKRERLEQLRALEAGMAIGVTLVDHVPFGVDTPADLERARAFFAHAQSEAPKAVGVKP